MIGGIIVSHGKLAEELLNALTIILGETVNIEAISIGWYDDVEASKKKINKSLKNVDQKNGVLIFTDMFGGTPSNLSFSFLKDNQVEIITGVNLPMLIKFASLQRSNSLQEVAKKVVEQGQKNIHWASALLRSKNWFSLASMIKKKVIIKNKLGLHARAAVKFMNLANRFASSVRIEKDGNEIDGKSILGILTLAAVQGSEITLKISGPDETQALNALVALIEKMFYEEE